MNRSRSLIIFAKNLVLGKVKTRLAADIGVAAAYNVYEQLLHHTWRVATGVMADRIIYYADHIEPSDEWSHEFRKAVQKGADLGERMKEAFREVFQEGVEKVLIIGTDCPGISTAIITDAYAALDATDVVIGPAHDGGYYLLGMRRFYPFLFDDISWSSNAVLQQTLARCAARELTVSQLMTLHDIDNAGDLPHLDQIHDN